MFSPGEPKEKTPEKSPEKEPVVEEVAPMEEEPVMVEEEPKEKSPEKEPEGSLEFIEVYEEMVSNYAFNKTLKFPSQYPLIWIAGYVKFLITSCRWNAAWYKLSLLFESYSNS